MRRGTDSTSTLLRTLVLALIFWASLGFALIWICDFLVLHSGLRLSRIANSPQSYDMMVVGNSRGVNLMAGTTTEKTTVFNLSYNALRRPAVTALVKEFFQRGNKARYVVIEASAWPMVEANCELKPYWRLLPLLREAAAPGCGTDTLYGGYFPLTLFNSEIFMRAIYYATVSRGGDQNWTNENRMTSLQCEELRNVGTRSTETTGYAAPNVADMRRDAEELKAWMREHAPGTKLIFVLAPYFSSSPMRPHAQAVSAALDSALGSRNYLNLSTELGANCDAFADALHVNGLMRPQIKAIVLDYAASQAPD